MSIEEISEAMFDIGTWEEGCRIWEHAKDFNMVDW